MANALGCTSLKKSVFYRNLLNPIISDGTCSQLRESAAGADAADKLSYVGILFHKECHEELIEIGSAVRKNNRDKYYSLRNELAEAVLYEGYMKEYTLEAYERVYLSLLMAISYKRKQKINEAKVELRRADEELNAQIYTYEEDEINLILMGLLWVQLGSREDADPYFRRVVGNEKYNLVAKELANSFLERPIGVMGKKSHVLTMGTLPSIDYSLFGKNDEFYKPDPSVKTCISNRVIILDTTSWIQQISGRDREERDAILKYKRAARMPATLLFTTLVLAVTGGLTLATVGSGSGQVTGLLAGISVALTYMTFKDGVSPDMRYWENLPQAFIFTESGYAWKNDPCLKLYPEKERIFRALL